METHAVRGGVGTITHEGMHIVQTIDDGNLANNNTLITGVRCQSNPSLCLDTLASTMSRLDYIQSPRTFPKAGVSGYVQKYTTAIDQYASYIGQERELANQVVNMIMDGRNFNWLQTDPKNSNFKHLLDANKFNSIHNQQQDLLNYFNQISQRP